MALRKRKPTSPGRRFQTVSDFAEITKTKPEKSLLAPKPKTGGRNSYGRKTARHKGGGHKRQYRVIDFRRTKDGVPAKVAVRRVRPEPQLPHPAAPLPGRREALHPRPAQREGGRHAAVRPGLGDPAGQRPCRCATSRSAPPCTTSSSSQAAAARWLARRGRACSSWPRRATSPPCGCPARRCAASRSTAGPRWARSATPRPSWSRSARPAATGGRAFARRPAASP